MKLRVLFFSPFQEIVNFSFIERKVAKILEDSQNFEVSFLGCDGIFGEFCVAMSAHQLTAASDAKAKTDVCVSCKKLRKKTWGERGNNTLENYLTASDLAAVNAELEKITEENIKNYVFDGFPMGRFASYELILSYKIPSMQEALSPQQYQSYRIELKNVITTYFALKTYLAKNPCDRIVVYNTNYSVNRMARDYAKRFNIECVFLHGSTEIQRVTDAMYISNSLPENHMRERLNYFEQNAATANVPASELERIETQLRTLFEAKSIWVYSSSRTSVSDAMSKLKLSPNDSVALMSLASQDEVHATDFAVMNDTYIPTCERVFKDQFEWLEKTAAFFAQHPEWKLVVRFHPREFPNKRDKVVAKSIQKYLPIIEKFPPNVIVNTPDDKVSIYDVFPFIKLNLTSWSSVGLESSLLGIPTMSATRKLSLYPNAYVHHFPKNELEFQKIITEIMNKARERDFDAAKRAVDWMLFDYTQPSVQFDTHSYWKKEMSLSTRVLRKIGLIDRSIIYRFKDFEKKCTIVNEESEMLQHFFKTLTPLYEIKAQHKVERASETQIKATIQSVMKKLEYEANSTKTT